MNDQDICRGPKSWERAHRRRVALKHTSILMTLISMSSSMIAPPLVSAEVGDPCVEASECEAGEVCAPGRLPEDGSFCTRTCRADRPCPEEYVCESNGGLSLCNTEVILSPLGAPCGAGCESGLICLADGEESYCSVSCTLPGSCPEGFRCRPGALNACAPITSLPSVGEPCTETEGCLEELECLALPNRALSYCTYTCAERACPSFMVCEDAGEEARCVHTPYESLLGEYCVETAFDESVKGCGQELLCEQLDARHICTQDCTSREPCPEGFGCVYRPSERDEPTTTGRCLPDVESDVGLMPEVQSPPSNAGEEITPPPMTGGVPPENIDSAGTETGSSCASHQPDCSHLLPLIAIFLLMLTAKMRRWILREAKSQE